MNIPIINTLIPYLMSGTVMELSAIFVARMTFLRPRSGARNALCCSSSVTLECRGRTVRLGEGRGRGECVGRGRGECEGRGKGGRGGAGYSAPEEFTLSAADKSWLAKHTHTHIQ